MTDPSSQPPRSEEFEDPLENYDPKTYDDPLEKALVEQPVTAIQLQPYVSVPPETRIDTALKELAGMHHACLLVEEGDKLVGVFSDRDVLDKVALEYDQVRDRPVKEVMTDHPVYVYDTDSSAATLTVMAVSGYRHVPVVDVNHKPVGIASPKRVTAFLQRLAETD